jgi:non-heme chloroperoxidase
MQTATVTGGGGLKLHVQETGNPNGKAILFIHGFSEAIWKQSLYNRRP